MKKEYLSITPLGGLGEIGMNMMLLTYGKRGIIIDCGILFAEVSPTEVDLHIPDFSFIRELPVEILGLIVTHGHEDHIGGIPFFLKSFKVPVYTKLFPWALIREKLRGDSSLLRLASDRISLPPFTVDFLEVSHSIVDSYGLAIRTPAGIVVHTGDFKIDPLLYKGKEISLESFVEVGKEKVLLLLSDSTNVEREGKSPSEHDLRKTFEGLFNKATGRIIISLFASNIRRVEQLTQLAVHHGKKVFFDGRALNVNMTLAKEHGFLRLPQDEAIRADELLQIPHENLVIFATGSQGEPGSSLAKMAFGEHPFLKITSKDTVIFSSRLIPGNERAIGRVINELYRKGAEVIYEKISDVHASGHAYQDDLRQMIRAVSPQYFIPIHGEFRHLAQHAELAANEGISKENVFVIEDGQTIEFLDGEARLGKKRNLSPVRTVRS